MAMPWHPGLARTRKPARQAPSGAVRDWNVSLERARSRGASAARMAVGAGEDSSAPFARRRGGGGALRQGGIGSSSAISFLPSIGGSGRGSLIARVGSVFAPECTRSGSSILTGCLIWTFFFMVTGCPIRLVLTWALTRLCRQERGSSSYELSQNSAAFRELG